MYAAQQAPAEQGQPQPGSRARPGRLQGLRDEHDPRRRPTTASRSRGRRDRTAARMSGPRNSTVTATPSGSRARERRTTSSSPRAPARSRPRCARPGGSAHSAAAGRRRGAAAVRDEQAQRRPTRRPRSPGRGSPPAPRRTAPRRCRRGRAAVPGPWSAALVTGSPYADGCRARRRVRRRAPAPAGPATRDLAPVPVAKCVTAWQVW